jgi:hypothetical protein
VFAGAAYGGYNPHNSYQEMLTLAQAKPIMIGEIGSVETGGSKADWITDMLQTQLPRHFPQIKAFVWTDARFAGANWPIESSASAQAAFAQGISSSYYATNSFGSLSASPIPPLSAVDGAATLSTIALQPVADTYTSRSAPESTAGGTTTYLRADAPGTDTAFLRFDLSALSGKTINSATLRLHSSTQRWAGSNATFDVKYVDSTDWKEANMSYENTVPVSKAVLGSLVAPNQPNTWYSIRLTPSRLQPNGEGWSRWRSAHALEMS